MFLNNYTCNLQFNHTLSNNYFWHFLHSNLPHTLRPLQRWLRRGTHSDVTGLDSDKCVVLLSRDYTQEELPIVPPPQELKEDLPYTCIVATPRKEVICLRDHSVTLFFFFLNMNNMHIWNSLRNLLNLWYVLHFEWNCNETLLTISSERVMRHLNSGWFYSLTLFSTVELQFGINWILYRSRPTYVS